MKFPLKEIEALNQLREDEGLETFIISRKCLDYFMQVSHAYISLLDDVEAALDSAPSIEDEEL